MRQVKSRKARQGKTRQDKTRQGKARQDRTRRLKPAPGDRESIVALEGLTVALSELEARSRLEGRHLLEQRQDPLGAPLQEAEDVVVVRELDAAVLHVHLERTHGRTAREKKIMQIFKKLKI